MRDINELFKALSRSAFRSKFHLQAKDLAYLQTKGLPTVIHHAGDFIAKRCDWHGSQLAGESPAIVL